MGSVLLVDDDPGFRAIARRVLVARGLTVVAEAETVAEAMEAAHAHRPTSALVDVQLPDGNGIELARDLLALPWRPRVLLTSANPAAARAAAFHGFGDDAFVAKDDLPSASLGTLLA
jgi:CheY-like chemotaxis protein